MWFVTFVRALLRVLTEFVRTTYRDGLYATLALGLIGAAIGFVAGLQPTHDWRNAAFGPWCGLVFWGFIGAWFGVWVDAEIARMTNFIRAHF